MTQDKFKKGSLRNFKQLWDHYHENYLGDFKIDQKDFYNILMIYLRKLQHELLYEGKDIHMGLMGLVRVVKHKPRVYKSKSEGGSLNIDFNLTRKYGKTIYHLNEHSGGYVYNFMWSKESKGVRNKIKYKMVATYTNKRTLANIIKNKVRDYVER